MALGRRVIRAIVGNLVVDLGQRRGEARSTQVRVARDKNRRHGVGQEAGIARVAGAHDQRHDRRLHRSRRHAVLQQRSGVDGVLQVV